jgi:hypothetical protein
MNNLPDNYKDYYTSKTCQVKRQVRNICNSTVGSLEIVKSQKCSGNLHVGGNATIHNINTHCLKSHSIYTNYIDISGDVTMLSNLNVNGDLLVREDVTMLSDLSVNGNLLVEEDVSMNKNVFIGGDLLVGEDVSMNKNVFIGGDLLVGTTDILKELSKQETRIIMEAEGPIEVGGSPFSQGMGSPSEPGFGTYEFNKSKITKISIIMYSPGLKFNYFSIKICSSDNLGNLDTPSLHILPKEGNTYVSDTINRNIEEKHIWWVEIDAIQIAHPGQDENQRLRLCAHILTE